MIAGVELMHRSLTIALALARLCTTTPVDTNRVPMKQSGSIASAAGTSLWFHARNGGNAIFFPIWCVLVAFILVAMTARIFSNAD
jgi:hypothetical protein